MNKQEFKTRFIKNLRFYLPQEFKDVKIEMRLAKKNEKRLIFDSEINSVRTVTHAGFKWRVETRKEVVGLSDMMLLAHYKTADVSWSYPKKNQ